MYVRNRVGPRMPFWFWKSVEFVKSDTRHLGNKSDLAESMDFLNLNGSLGPTLLFIYTGHQHVL